MKSKRAKWETKLFSRGLSEADIGLLRKDKGEAAMKLFAARLPRSYLLDLAQLEWLGIEPEGSRKMFPAALLERMGFSDEAIFDMVRSLNADELISRIYDIQGASAN